MEHGSEHDLVRSVPRTDLDDLARPVPLHMAEIPTERLTIDALDQHLRELAAMLARRHTSSTRSRLSSS